MADIPQDRWTRIEALVDQALDLPAGERADFLRVACGHDVTLRQAAGEWLAACENPSLFPDAQAAVFAAPLLSGGDARFSDGEPPAPQRVGPYRILHELGRGGMGTVFLAERDDGQLDRRVAVKVMRRGADDATLRRRFVDERQILARLEHPHIATLLDGGITPDGRLYLVMQYVEGVPIDRYCDDLGLPVDARLRIFVSVCGAVQHAHRNQVVHRDLKPGNILVTPEGQPKLLDFGIAKLLQPASSPSPELTRTGERLLTPEYASPEQIRGEAVTPASDVHALGVLLHRLLTGQRPFRRQALSSHELERAILEDDPTQPSDVVTAPGERRRLRGDLDAIVLTALRKDKSRRYADAGQLADDIERHLDGRPVRARGRAPAYRLRAVLRQHRGLVNAGAVGALVGAAALALWSWPSRLPADSAASVVLAIGRIADYRDGPDVQSAAPLVDMLATNLARAPGLSVVSAGRMYDLVAQVGSEVAAEEATFRAARNAGATQLLTGAIHALPSGEVRLDLQRVDVASGTILGAHSALGADLYGLADTATSHVVADLGLAAPVGSIADVTTRSLAAYRHYTEGLQHFSAGRLAAADTAFGAALREDSTFAMAALYHARSSGYQWRFASATTTDRAEFEGRYARAQRLAGKASDRERLMIRAYYETYHLSPAAMAVAETLAVRYPREIDGHLMLGINQAMQGDLQPAIARYSRVLEMDSASMRLGADRCAGCVAINSLVEAAVLMDSLHQAEHYARLWLELQPSSIGARGNLVQVLDAQGRFREAAVLLRSAPVAGTAQDSVIELAKHLIRAGELPVADTLLDTWIRRSSGRTGTPLLFLRAVVLRNQGRLQDALVVARHLRTSSGDRVLGGAAPPSAMVQAQTLFDMGRMRAASALFDSISRWPATGQPPSVQATFRVLALSMSAASLHAAGDTSRLAALADTVEGDGRRVLLSRPQDQHHFVRGLLQAMRRNGPAAIDAFRSALKHVTIDFGRANMELAGLYLQENRPGDAIAALRPASRGWFIETTNLHLTLTEVHERLAQAHEQAGAPDSAAAHWTWVARSWQSADAGFRERREHAAARAAAIADSARIAR